MKFYIGGFFTKTYRQNPYLVTFGRKCWVALWLKPEVTVAGDTVAVKSIDHYRVFDDGV